MITTINNDLRVFQVLTSNNKQYFCNITDLNEICKDLQPGYFKINHFWNNKAERVTKKALKSFYEGSGLTQNFYY